MRNWVRALLTIIGIGGAVYVAACYDNAVSPDRIAIELPRYEGFWVCPSGEINTTECLFGEPEWCSDATSASGAYCAGGAMLEICDPWAVQIFGPAECQYEPPCPPEYSEYCNGEGGGGPPPVQPPTPVVNLTCPESVVRGEPAQCAVTVQGNETVNVQSWCFHPLSPDVPTMCREDDMSSQSWSGTMVVSGTVQVQVQLSEQGFTEKSVLIQVQPRSNFPNAVSLEVTRLAHDMEKLTYEPVLKSHFGSAKGYLRLLNPQATSDSSTARVNDGGPNNGYYYFTKMPFLEVEIMINDAAFNTSGSFYLKHPVVRGSGNPPMCSRSDVLAQEPMIIDHEGLTRKQYSHAIAFRDFFQGNTAFQSKIEGIVLAVTSYHNSVLENRTAYIWTSADQYSNDVAHGSNNLWQPACYMMGVNYAS